VLSNLGLTIFIYAVIGHVGTQIVKEGSYR